MPQVNGILETAIYVADLARSGDWYERVFGFRELMADDRMRAYDVNGQNVLLLFRVGGSVSGEQTPGGFIPPHDAQGRQHFAFRIAADAVEEWEQTLSEQNVAIESKVVCDDGKGGTSLYFRDPDCHLVELITPNCWPIF